MVASTSLRIVSLSISLMLVSLSPAVRAKDTSVREVLVVTDRQHPVRAPTGARVIELDALEYLETHLSASLPRDPKQAAVIAQQRLADRGSEMRERLARAYQGIVDAWALGVTKVPAVIVDRVYVVYGEPNVDRAIAKIDVYRGKQP